MFHLITGILLFANLQTAVAAVAPSTAASAAHLAPVTAAVPHFILADGNGSNGGTSTADGNGSTGQGAGNGSAGQGDGCGTINGIDPCAIKDSVNFDNVKKSSTGMVDNFNMILVGLVVGIAVLVGLSIAILMMVHNRNTRKIQELHSGMARLAEGYGFALAIPLFLGIVGMLVKAAGVVK